MRRDAHTVSRQSSKQARVLSLRDDHRAASVVRDKEGPDKGRLLAEGCQHAGLRRSLKKEKAKEVESIRRSKDAPG